MKHTPNMVLMPLEPTEKHPNPVAFLVYSDTEKFIVLKRLGMKQRCTIKLYKKLYEAGYRNVGSWKRINPTTIMLPIIKHG